MGIKTGDLVLVVKDSDNIKIGMKCYPATHYNQFVVTPECLAGHRAAIYVVPMKYENDLGLKAKLLLHNNQQLYAGVTAARSSFIAMSWIDEADIYEDSPYPYLTDVYRFRNIASKSTSWTACCQSPMGTNPRQGIEFCVHVPSGYPQDLGVNIYMENINRPPSNSQLINRFNLLLAEYRINAPDHLWDPEYIILTVDNSGSMSTATIQPAYNNLKIHIASTCPNSELRETEYSNEVWLSLWYDQIESII